MNLCWCCLRYVVVSVSECFRVDHICLPSLVICSELSKYLRYVTTVVCHELFWRGAAAACHNFYSIYFYAKLGCPKPTNDCLMRFFMQTLIVSRAGYSIWISCLRQVLCATTFTCSWAMFGLLQGAMEGGS